MSNCHRDPGNTSSDATFYIHIYGFIWCFTWFDSTVGKAGEERERGLWHTAKIPGSWTQAWATVGSNQPGYVVYHFWFLHVHDLHITNCVITWLSLKHDSSIPVHPVIQCCRLLGMLLGWWHLFCIIISDADTILHQSKNHKSLPLLAKTFIMLIGITMVAVAAESSVVVFFFLQYGHVIESSLWGFSYWQNREQGRCRGSNNSIIVNTKFV